MLVFMQKDLDIVDMFSMPAFPSPIEPTNAQ